MWAAMTRQLLAAALALAGAGGAAAADLRVPQDHKTVQAAVDAAKPGDTVVVAPGVAIDAEGRTIILTRVVRLVMKEAKERFVVLQFKPAKDAASKVQVGGGVEYYRLVESADVVDVDALPKTPHVELARVLRSAADKAVKEPGNPFDPGKDELNTLHRPLAFPHCYADGYVGEVYLLPKNDPLAVKPNRAGLFNLLREGNGRGFHLTFSGLYIFKEGVVQPDPFLLYVAGKEEFKAPSDEQVEGIKKFLASGGTLFAEACGGAASFVKAFETLAKSLGASLKKVDANHPLLASHFMFPGIPPGAAAGDVLADLDRGVILSTCDFGAAWQGSVGKVDAAMGRERIRSSVEFGLNVLAMAHRRKRTKTLEKLA